MSILFSRQCEYALQAVSYLALQSNGKLIPIKELTDRLKIPYYFLGKILHDLVQKGILVSQKGNKGGFALGKSPEDISYLDIIESIDGPQFKYQCAMGFAECSLDSKCAIHDQWEKSRTELSELFAGKNVSAMAKAMKRSEYL